MRRIPRSGARHAPLSPESSLLGSSHASPSRARCYEPPCPRGNNLTSHEALDAAAKPPQQSSPHPRAWCRHSWSSLSMEGPSVGSEGGKMEKRVRRNWREMEGSGWLQW
uniref:Uncharacterized protein n=1 Tax=Setaria viridis TaxID=4556 RepID=A0A4U6SVE7_SETVI|nr:hypothetical protein SEVIR_9G192501v2 [Setaria viridis]